MGTMEKIIRTTNSNAFVLSQALERDKIITKGNMTAHNEPKYILFLKTHRLESQVHIKLIKRCPTPNSTKVDHPGGGTSVQGCYDFVSIWFFFTQTLE